ncbi:exosome complex component RRP40-like [Lineus longissimus]|uniref:exosome complex component RRP40-like n=1 Tax=Lineus longissimus TaxID=88925 RepID=UPI002B4C964C
MADSTNDVVMPGDVLHNLKTSDTSGKIVIGPGLRRDSDNIIVTKPGVVRFKDPNIYWVDCYQKRYVPARGESVIGIVTMKAGDIFKLDVGASEQATLSFLSFEGATKKNRPNCKVGDIVYAKFAVANKDMERELVCIGSNGKSGGLGVIKGGGLLFHSSLYLCRKILSPDCVLLKTLGRSMPYEIAIGMNGRIWIKGRSAGEAIAIYNGITCAEHMDNEQIKVMCKKLLDALAGFASFGAD